MAIPRCPLFHSVGPSTCCGYHVGIGIPTLCGKRLRWPPKIKFSSSVLCQQGIVLEELGLCSVVDVLRFWINGVPPCRDPSLVIQNQEFDGVPVRIYSSRTVPTTKRKAVLYFHGGAGVFGSIGKATETIPSPPRTAKPRKLGNARAIIAGTLKTSHVMSKPFQGGWLPKHNTEMFTKVAWHSTSFNVSASPCFSRSRSPFVTHRQRHRERESNGYNYPH